MMHLKKVIQLYDHWLLEERASKNLRAWKACHIILYCCVTVFGILNFIFLHNTMSLVGEQCVLYPRIFEFSMIPLPNVTDRGDDTKYLTETDLETVKFNTSSNALNNFSTEKTTLHSTEKSINEGFDRSKRDSFDTDKNAESVHIDNTTEAEMIMTNRSTVVINNGTHRLALDPFRSFLGKTSDCELALYVPILSTISAMIWLVMFSICANGGRPKSGLPEPWRILVPALVFAVVLIIPTAVSFSYTDGGLQQFCADFYNVTGSTKCSEADSVMPDSEAPWRLSALVAAARACSAGVVATWTCIAALLLARYLLAPDFAFKRITAHLHDHNETLSSYLPQSSYRTQSSRRSNLSTTTYKSVPTRTDLVTVSSEHDDADSDPTLLVVTNETNPKKKLADIEMT